MRSMRGEPQGRVSRWFERIALGAIMGVVAFVVERRLKKMIRRGEAAGREAGAKEVELSAAPEQVDQQSQG